MFEIFTQPNYPNAAIGIESETVTAVSLSKDGQNRYSINRASAIEVPKGLLRPSFSETNISAPQEFRVILEEAVTSAGLLGQKKWSVSLPSNAARTAIITVENDKDIKNNLTEVIDWKSEQSFGCPAAEMRLSYFPISNDREGRLRFFAAAIKLTILDEYETIFEDFGWQAGLILPRAVAETRWILSEGEEVDSLLISSQSDGFVALLLRRGEPRVVRSVSCTVNEIEDEVYRLLMYYNDRFADSPDGVRLSRLLLIGGELVPQQIIAVCREALGKAATILRAEDVGLRLPNEALDFEGLAAPAGLASLAFR